MNQSIIDGRFGSVAGRNGPITGGRLLGRVSKSWLLQRFPGVATGAYSIRRLGSVTRCVRIRRSSDNAEQDFGFLGGVVDNAAIAAFVGGGTGYVTTWYDQSGNGKDVSQSTAANQPAWTTQGPSFVAASSTSLTRAQDVLSAGNGGCCLSAVLTATNISSSLKLAVCVGANVTGQRPSIFITSGNRVQVSYNGDVVTGSVWGSGTQKVITATWDNQINELIENGAVSSAAATALNVGTSEFAIGKTSGAASSFWDGVVSEVIVINSAYAAHAALHAAQRTYYGL